MARKHGVEILFTLEHTLKRIGVVPYHAGPYWWFGVHQIKPRFTQNVLEYLLLIVRAANDNMHNSNNKQ